MIKVLVLVSAILIGGSVDFIAYKNHHQPVKQPTPITEPANEPEPTTNTPQTINSPDSHPALTPLSAPKVDLNPYKYSVPINAGQVDYPTFSSPPPPAYTPPSYTPTPPTVTWPPADNCHTVLNC